MTKFSYTLKIHLNQSINCLLIKEKKEEWKKIENLKVFNDYSQTSDDDCENLEDYNPAKKRKVLIVFDDMIADIESK